MKRFWAWSFVLFFILPIKLKAVPLYLNYQGRMTQTGGAPVPDSTTNTAQFALWTAASGGTSPWSESDTVATKNGLFNVELGHNSTLNLPFDQPYWLEITWAGITMSPRQPLDTSPYAFRAAVADNATVATTALNFGLPQNLSGSSGAALLAVSNTGGVSIQGVSSASDGLLGQGSQAGVLGQAGANGGSGVYADYNGIGGAYALSVSGPARFMGGPVSFTGAVDFTGATVTGLSGGVTAPLSLTGSGVTTISAFNLSGVGLFAQGQAGGISATASNGPAIYAQGSGGTSMAAIKAVTSGTGHGVEGSNSQFGSLGILGGDLSAGYPGVYGINGTNSNQAVGVHGESPYAVGVLGDGLVGVEGKVTNTGQTGILADWGGFAGSSAMVVSGPAQFWGGPVSFTGSVDFSGATVTGLAGGGVPVPLSLTGNTPMGGAVIRGINLGSGYGVMGRDSQPGSQDAQGNPLTINAGVYGFTASTNSAGVFGESLAATATAGVAGRGWTGVYGVGLGPGTGGEFQAISGTGVGGYGVTGVAGTANAGGVGVLAYDNGAGAGTLALMAQGASVFNGPVTFNGTVTGLSASVSAPLDLTSPSQAAAVFGFNPGGTGLAGQSNGTFGAGVLALGMTTGLSATATNSSMGAAVLAQGAYVGVSASAAGIGPCAVYGTGGATAAVLGDNGGAGTGYGVEGLSGSNIGVFGNSVNSMGVEGSSSALASPGVQGINSNGGSGVQGQASSTVLGPQNSGVSGGNSGSGAGVWAQSTSGPGLMAQGVTGVVAVGSSVALYVSGTVKTSIESLSIAPTLTMTAAASGSAPMLNITAAGAAAVYHLSVTDPLVTASSSVTFNFVGFTTIPTTSYVVLVNSGTIDVYFTGGNVTVTTGKGFNFLIVN